MEEEKEVEPAVLVRESDWLVRVFPSYSFTFSEQRSKPLGGN